MPQATLKLARGLSLAIALLAAAASAGGLLIPGLYQDNAFVTAAWKGTDLVTLLICIPLLVAFLPRSSGHSRRAALVWLGLLDYMLYNYAFYLFGASFNALFLLYVALVGLSAAALIVGLSGIDAQETARELAPAGPVWVIVANMLFVALGLSAIYIAQSLAYVLTGQLPAIVVRTGHPTSVIFALDLTLLVPVLALGARWLWARRPWGYVLAGISVVKGPLYTLALTSGSLWAARSGMPEALAEVPLWLMLTIMGAGVAGLLFVRRR